MKRLIIIGAGGFGREVLAWARQCPEFRRDWEIAGFLDDNLEATAAYVIDVPILGRVDAWQPASDDLFVCAIANPAAKRRCTTQIEQRGGIFTRLIHPSVIFGERVELADGVILCPRATLTCDIKVGRHSAINLFTAVGHDARIGNYCQMHSYTEACGHVVLENEVLMGTHATILPGKRVGQGAVVGAGSVVLSDVPAGVTVVGTPAKRL